MHGMGIKGLKRENETKREKVGEEWKYVQKEDKSKRKTEGGGDRRRHNEILQNESKKTHMRKEGGKK